MQFLYKCFEEHLWEKEYGSYIGYGIAIFEFSGKGTKCIKRYSDLFLEQKEAETFANLCTREQVEPIHFLEIVEDFLP